jgi:hypothetical protein
MIIFTGEDKLEYCKLCKCKMDIFVYIFLNFILKVLNCGAREIGR